MFEASYYYTHTKARDPIQTLSLPEGLYFIGAISRLSGSYPYLSGNVWLDEVSCEGNESHLLNCTYKVIGKVHPYIHASVVECLSKLSNSYIMIICSLVSVVQGQYMHTFSLKHNFQVVV